MTGFVLRRVLQTIVVLFMLSFVCFYLMTLMPGDPVDIMISSNPHFTAADRARLRKLYGLNQPVTKRYMHWLKSTFSGDFGYSRTYQVPVMQLVGPRLINTFYLSALSLFLALLFAIPIGVYAALKPGSLFDYVVNLIALSGISVPSFWLGILLILGFAVEFHLLPASGTLSMDHANMGWAAAFWDRLRYMALPAATLTILQVGVFVRYTRGSMISAMRNDFIRTARAKGLSRWRVIWGHGFRNALIPILTMLGIQIGTLLSGAIITEQVFDYQGVGKLFFDSLSNNDFNVSMVILNIGVFAVLMGNLMGDLLNGFADPRISR